MNNIIRKSIVKGLLEEINRYSCIYITAISGCGKSETVKSLFSKQECEYIDINKATTIHNINKSIIIFDHLQNASNELLLQIKHIIEDDQYKIILVSNQSLPEELYDLLLYKKLHIINNLSWFFTRQELNLLARQDSLDKQFTQEIYEYARGWPLCMNYIYNNQNHVELDKVLIHFFDSILFTDKQFELLQAITFLPYIDRKMIIEIFGNEYKDDLSILLNNQLVVKEENIEIIPILKDYILYKYSNNQEYYYNKALPYYNKYHFLLEQFILSDTKDIDITKYEHCLENLSYDDYCKYQITSDYLEGIYAYRRNDYDTYQRMLDKLLKNQEHNKYINLLYIDPTKDFIASKTVYDTLYLFNKEVPSLLNGKRELTTIASLKYNDEAKYNELLSKLNHYERILFNLLDIEYLYHRYEIKKALTKLNKFIASNKQEFDGVINMMIGVLAYLVYDGLGETSTGKFYYHEYKQELINKYPNLNKEYLVPFDGYIVIHEENIEASYDVYRAIPKEMEIGLDNYNQFYILARHYYLNEMYDKANFHFTKLFNYAIANHRTILSGESLFYIACCQQAMNNTKLAIKNFTMCLYALAPYRYIEPFMVNSKYALELIDNYMEILGHTSNEYDEYLELIHKSLVSFMNNHPKSGVDNASLLDNLTVKETAVLKLIGKGYTNKEIQEELHVSLPTVKTHVSNIFSKLGVKNRSQTIKFIEMNNLFE